MKEKYITRCYREGEIHFKYFHAECFTEAKDIFNRVDLPNGFAHPTSYYLAKTETCDCCGGSLVKAPNQHA